jgi:hypothetical protein
MNRRADPRVDGCWDGAGAPILVEVKKTNSARDLRDALLALVYALADHPSSARVVGVVTASRLSDARVLAELQQFRSLLRQDLRQRVHCLLHGPDDTFTGSLMDEPNAFYDWLRKMVAQELGGASARQGSPRSVFPARHAVIVTLLAHRFWADDQTPMKVGALQSRAGVSYPTVAAALEDLRAKGLIDNTGTAVRLGKLSTRDLMQFAREHAALRGSKYYVDPTGIETPSHLMQRLAKKQDAGKVPKAVRVGGVAGAAHHFPDLDISAPARLDVSVQGCDLGFVRAIDAGLVERTDPTQKVLLAVHPSWDPALANDRAARGIHSRFANPMDCLADLIDLGYIREAEEMARHLTEATPTTDQHPKR